MKNNKTKAALKNMVKECLIEILAEGLVGNPSNATLSEKRELRGALHESYDRSKSKNIMEQNLMQSTQVSNSILIGSYSPKDTNLPS